MEQSKSSEFCCIFAAKKPQKIEIMEATARTLANDKTHFATLAIGATAKEMGITETELYVKKFGMKSSKSSE